MPLKFLKGLKQNLPDSIKEGNFYITTDSQELFVDISDDERINLGNKIILSDWSQTDETAPDYIKNKPDKDDALELLVETGLIEPIVDENGAIYTDENGNIYNII